MKQQPLSSRPPAPAPQATHYVAIDLGATSGRVILGALYPDGHLTTEEIHRFPNAMLRLGGHRYWDIYALYDHIVEGLRRVAATGFSPRSIGIDTWGVDVAFVAPGGRLMGLPFAYRDPDTIGAAARFFGEVMDADTLYSLTGIQHLDFNTIFQLHARRSDWQQLHADTILFMPDALSYLLTGRMVTEYTIASTGALVDPATRRINPALAAAAGTDAARFAPAVEPGTVIGTLLPEIAAATGLGEIDVVAVAGHDTASAIAAVPAATPGFAYLSSGTWSLMGVESPRPVINELTRRENITNEGGVYGTVRLLKNITGMWVLEECMRQWKLRGENHTYDELLFLASEAEPFRSFIDTDAPCFVAPDDMPAAIDDFCRRTGQPLPRSTGEYVRTILESLAMRYRYVMRVLTQLVDTPPAVLHVIGGGSRNDLLNHMTADALAMPVVAGPAEASAIGNLLMQTAQPSLEALRRVVRASVPTATFSPSHPEAWDEAWPRYLAATGHKEQ